MARLEMMEIFVAVAEEQSFAGGARRLNLSAPAVTRAIAALEGRLGVILLTRTTRYVRVTDAGQRYLEDARRILQDANEADEAAAGINAEPRGHLAVTAPVLFGRMFVTPGIVDYLQRFPAMDVSAIFLDRIVNMLEEGIDVGIRIGELPDSSMRAIRVGHVRQVLCASPSYLAAKGMPKTPDALSHHSLIAAATGSWSSIEWKFLDGDKIMTFKIKPRLSVTSNDAAIEAAINNLGITRILSYQIAPFLASGQVQTLLSNYEPKHLPIHVLHREGRYSSVKVRAFVDLMSECIFWLQLNSHRNTQSERLRADQVLN